MKVKWGVIGAGGIADRRTIPGMLLTSNAELEAVMEVNIDLANRIAEKYNAKNAYDNVDDLLENPNIEAVYIASPVVFHKEQAIKAAKAKKHILLEKPVAITLVDAEEVLKVIKENGVLAASGFVMRFHSHHRKMREIVQAGKIGQIVSCRAQLTCWYPEIEGAWRQKKSMSGGGAIMDLAVHCIDLIQYVIGSKVKMVAAMVGTKTFNYEIDDSASLLFETENRTYCYVDANFNIPDSASKNRFEIYGTAGSMLAEGTINQIEDGRLDVILSNDSLGYSSIQNRHESSITTINLEKGNIYTKEIESFSNSILKGIPIEVSLEDAIQVQKVVEAACESSKKKCFVTI